MTQKGIIYKLTSPSGKSYIGQTTKTLDERFEQHSKSKACVLIHRAIQKYGLENIKKEIIAFADVNYLDDIETYYIVEFNTLCPNGYNIRTGGAKGSRHCAESREKMRQSKLGENNHNYGKPRTEEPKKQRKKYQKKNKGRSIISLAKNYQTNININVHCLIEKMKKIRVYLCIL
jgi:group I intron endonuclease